MIIKAIEILLQLITFNIGIYVAAKSIQVDKLDGEFSNKIASMIFSKYRKKTKMHWLVLVINLLAIFVALVSESANSINEETNFFQALLNVFTQLTNELPGILILYSIIIVLSIILTYRAFPVKNDIDGNRHLSAKDIDKEYVNFSKPDCIDGHSTLLLIAGDLSFLGNIPDIKDFEKEKKQKKCNKILSENSLKHSCCKAIRCPFSGKCIEKSAQFEQLFDLKNSEITLNIISQEPNPTSDIPYKRRLGRLKEIFSDNFEVRFLPKDTLGSGICVLGRIKVNGGMQELFWHWKDPKKPGTYTVPNTKKADSSENKTLIYLLGTMLWDSAKKVDSSTIDQYVEEYKKAIEINS